MSRVLDLARAESAQYLAGTYLLRIGRALEALPPEDLWWRPHAGVPSVGNLLLHLEGNVRQWILSGLGGAPDARDRATEFAADGAGARDGPALLAALERTVQAAAEVVRRLPDAVLEGPAEIQGFETTGLAAVLHVVEHFSWHTGQIVWIAKARAGAGHGVAFYDDAAVNAARNDG